MIRETLKIVGLNLLLCIVGITVMQAQPMRKPLMPEGSKKDAETFLYYGNFKKAYEEFNNLLRQDSRNVDYNFKIAECILNMDIDRSEAITHLEYVVKKDTTEKFPMVELGKAYKYAYRFEDAMRCFENYLKWPGAKADVSEEVAREIDMCKTAQELMKFPLNVTIENLGKEINSEFPDYSPFVTENESELYYNTKREGKTISQETYDGYAPSDIYVSFSKNGKWQTGKNMGKGVNSPTTEEIVGMSSDASHIIMYMDNFFDVFEDLWILNKKGKSYLKPEPLNSVVNSQSSETSGTCTPDGKMFLFTSDRPGGYGGNDIYMVRRLPNSVWGEVQNLGPVINTKFDDAFPNISNDGKTLYFCSKGHTNMGGYDLFKSSYNDSLGEWSEPQNLGYPINTINDDKTISFDKTGKYAYVSSVRKGGFGNLDIYKVTFNTVESKLSVVHGVFVVGKDTLSRKKDNLYLLPDLTVKAFNTKTNELYGTYIPNKNTGKFVFIAPPGNYRIDIEDEDTNIGSLKFEVFGLGTFASELTKFVAIKPLHPAPKPVVIPPVKESPVLQPTNSPPTPVINKK